MKIVSKLFRADVSGRWSLKNIVKPILDRSLFQKPFSGNRKSVLLIYFHNNVGVSQIEPFFYYYRELTREHGVELRAVSLAEFLNAGYSGPQSADVVALQTWFEMSDDEKTKIFQLINTRNPDAKIVYLDWFAPIDLRLADFLNDKIDLYVKKQIYTDTARYNEPTYGATNLEDFYGRLYGIEFQQHSYRVPPGFLQKLILGPGFFTSTYLLENFVAPTPPQQTQRTIDVHARIASGRDDWYGKMRQQALDAVLAIKGRNVVTGVGVGRQEFLKELRESKLCFSPFGYGEVCWRDYEAVMTGSLLVKPDMSHLKTEPNIFIPYETYVPVNWEFTDLQEKVEHYLHHHEERNRIAQSAYRVIHEYVREKRFLDFASKILETSLSSLVTN